MGQHPSTRRKLLTAILLGQLGLWGSLLAIDFAAPPVFISLHFSLMIALLSALAYGPWYGLVTAATGGAFYPFLLWPTNGYANLVPSFLELVWFVTHGFFAQQRSASPSLWNRPMIVQLIYASIYSYVVVMLYPLFLAWNPAPWASDSVGYIPAEVLRAIGIKSWLLSLMITFGAVVLMRIPPVRRLMGLSVAEHARDHGRILLLSMTGAMTMWCISLLLDFLLIHNQKIFVSMSPHDILTLLVLLTTGLATADVVMSDVERRQDAEEHLRHSDRKIEEEKELLAVTLRSIGDGVITTDTRARVILLNSVAELLTGWSQEEAQGKPLTEVFHIINEVTRNTCDNPAEKVLASGQIIELANHTLLIDRSGAERVIADSGAPIRDRNGDIIGVVLVFRDTTEKQKLIESMQRTDKLEALGVLAGGIAHDFNNLLSGLLGYIELAHMKSPPGTPVVKLLDKAMLAFDRAKWLTQQLLVFAKGGEPARKYGSLAPLLRENSAFALSGSSVSCVYEISDELWLCNFDPGQLGQVIDNLVINARQSMPSGGQIRLLARNILLHEGEKNSLPAGRYVEFSVRDTGSGIAPKLRGRIFDPFFTTKNNGHGLGLATCYSIIKKHEGIIEVFSELDSGSEFFVYLPAVDLVEPDKSLTRPLDAVIYGNGCIIVMDDEPVLRGIIEEMLQTLGYTVALATNGQEAVAMCEKARKSGAPFVAAFFDLTVPGGMGGEEAMQIIRKSSPELSVFAVSGYSDNPIMARPTEFGFRDSLKKPFRLAELTALLNRHPGPHLRNNRIV